eukprot:UN07990
MNQKSFSRLFSSPSTQIPKLGMNLKKFHIKSKRNTCVMKSFPSVREAYDSNQKPSYLPDALSER